jgi:hypothetical protein
MLNRLPSGRGVWAASFVALCLAAPSIVSAAVGTCKAPLTKNIPTRSLEALPGSVVISRVKESSGSKRDIAIQAELLSGNLPSFLHELVPVTLAGTLSTGRKVLVTLCVTPEYLAVGSDRDFVRVPLGLAAAARIASEFGFLLPTTKMVDAIYQQASVKVSPSPMKPTSQMTSTSYFLAHNETVERQLTQVGGTRAELSAGHKKDLVLSNRLNSKPGRVAIYGWHRLNGKPIQPLSTVHGDEYADYSHGVRLVSRMAYVDGEPMALDEILQAKALSGIISSEGPIENVDGLLQTYSSKEPN